MSRSITPDPAPATLSDSQKIPSKSADGLPRTLPSTDEEQQHARSALRDSSVRYYVLAIVVVVLALIITLQVDLLATRTPFALFFAAVVTGTWYGGRNPGLVVIAFSSAVCAYFIIPPYSLIPDLNGALQLAVFVSVALVINWLMTTRRDTERSLKRSEARYRLLFESSPLAMWVYDLETLQFLEVNDAAIHLYGYSRAEFLSMTIKDIRPLEEIPRLMAEISNVDDAFGRPQVWRHKKKDGTVIDVEITAHSFVFNRRPARLVLASDVTERRTLEDQLRQSQKMEAIGLLAGGIAHDFNNLLTAITGYSELALRLIDHDDPAQPKVQEILKAGQRATDLTRQLLAFSRKQVLQPKVLNINSVVSEIGKILGRLIGEDVELRTVLDPGLGSVKADPGQLEQILMNLVVNARDAMPNGGKLTLETKNVYLDEDYAKLHLSVVPGPFVMLAVSDTGVGMDELTRERIFEPFFSTKDPGKGTGLGLSTTYGIVKQSGGNIWVYSEPGKGTTFKVYLPLIEEHPHRLDITNAPGDVLHGSETILIAEDEEIVRSLARQVLEMYGYQVLEAASGASALLMFEGYRERIDLLITDVIMPEMSGRELVSRMASVRPGIKVLYMSGYTDSAIVHQGVLDEDANFIQKPFATEALALKVRQVLDGTRKE